MSNELSIVNTIIYFSTAFLIAIMLCSLSERGHSRTVMFGSFRLFNIKFGKLILLFLAAQPLIYLFAERSLEVGTDTAYTYYPYYYLGYCKAGKVYEGIEYAFIELFRFAYNVTDSFNGCLWVIGEILIVLFLCVLSKCFSKKNLCIAVIIFISYYYFPSFNILRQSFAMMIIVLAIDQLRLKKYFSFVVWVALASLFHTSALVCLPIILFDVVSKKTRKTRIFLLITIVISITSISSIYSFLVNSSIFSKLGNYNLSTNIPFSEMLMFAFKGLLFELPVILLFVFTVLNHVRKLEGWDFTIFSMLLAECCFWLVASINPVFMRLSYFYQLSIFWAIFRVMEFCTTKQSEMLVKIGFITYLFVRMFLFYFVWGYDAIIPYSFA